MDDLFWQSKGIPKNLEPILGSKTVRNYSWGISTSIAAEKSDNYLFNESQFWES